LLVELHTPPEGVQVSAVVEPEQTDVLPDIALGNALVVNASVAMVPQPEL
jgi:hypothetical protein